MKSLFGALLCFVLAQTQAWAISGGPNYNGSSTSFVGSYAGVLQPTFCAEPNPANCPGLNSLGVFSIGVPSTGTASGSFVMFTRGRVFSGTITGTADPNKKALNAILSASFNYTLHQIASDGSVTDIQVTAQANGSLNAKFNTAAAARFNTTSSTTLKGSATLDVNEGGVNRATGDPIITGVLSLNVSGFRQSTTAPTSTSASPAPSAAG